MSATAAPPTLIQLDVASGRRKPTGWVGLGAEAGPGVDLVHDPLNFPWPVRSDSVVEASCLGFAHLIPHREAPYVEIVPGLRGGTIHMLAQERWASSVLRCGRVRDLWWDFWEELHRVMVPGGLVTVVTPHPASAEAEADPTCERRITEGTFRHLSQTWLRKLDLRRPYAADFEVEPTSPMAQARMGWSVVDDLMTVLRAGKPSACWWKGEGGR